VRKLVLAGVIVVVGLGATAAFAVARHGGSGTSAVDGPSLTVSSLAAAPGDEITIAGTGCGVDEPPTAGEWQARVWLTPAPGTVEWQDSFGDPVAVLAPDDGGSWSVTLTVPEWHTEYQLEAACFDEAIPPAGFLYAHQVLDTR